MERRRVCGTHRPFEGCVVCVEFGHWDVHSRGERYTCVVRSSETEAVRGPLDRTPILTIISDISDFTPVFYIYSMV